MYRTGWLLLLVVVTHRPAGQWARLPGPARGVARRGLVAARLGPATLIRTRVELDADRAWLSWPPSAPGITASARSAQPA